MPVIVKQTKRETIRVPGSTNRVIVRERRRRESVEIPGRRGPKGQKGDKGDEGDQGPSGAGDILAGAGLTKTDDTIAADFGSGAGKTAQGDDPRFTDARPPTAHTHPQGDVTGLGAALAAKQDASTAATDSELAAEATARADADDLRSDDIAAEASARAAADTTLTAEAAAAQATADDALPKAGGTMTGKIVLDGDPTQNLHPTTRQWVTVQINALINGAPSTLDTLKEIADQLGSDESAVSALTATVAGKLSAASNLSDLANAVTARANLGLGSAATHGAGDFDSAGAAAAAQAASQPLSADLTAIDALNTATFGRSFLELANAAAGRTLLALGNAATKDVGTASGTVAAGDDARLSDERVPTNGSVTATKIDGTLKPSGSAASTDESLRRLGTGSAHAAAGDDSRLPTAGQKNALAGLHGTPGTGNEYATKQSIGAAGAAGKALAADDATTINSRTPTAHKSSHAVGGSDVLSASDLGLTRTLFTDIADAGTGNVNTEVDLYSHSIPAGQLAANGDSIEGYFAGVGKLHASNTRRIRAYFAGTALIDSSALAMTALDRSWVVRYQIIRVSSSVVRWAATIIVGVGSITDTNRVLQGEITGLTLANAQTLKVSGQNSGTDTDGVKATSGKVRYVP